MEARARSPISSPISTQRHHGSRAPRMCPNAPAHTLRQPPADDLHCLAITDVAMALQNRFASLCIQLLVNNMLPDGLVRCKYCEDVPERASKQRQQGDNGAFLITGKHNLTTHTSKNDRKHLATWRAQLRKTKAIRRTVTYCMLHRNFRRKAVRSMVTYTTAR